ncbi:MAG: serine/threonine-protein kinase [Myxococcota bacterium]
MGIERELALRSVEQGLFGSRWSIGRYEVLRRLGEGGMGEVFLARDPRLDRRVAIKILRGSQTARDRRRLRREAQALAALAHPNVVEIYEVGEHQGAPFIAMEYIPGPTLGRWLEEQRPGRAALLRIFLAIARGLAAAHSQGIVHRDFKPSNVIVGTDDRPRILDFGIARATNPVGSEEDLGRGSTVPLTNPAETSGKHPAETPAEITRTDAVVGTPLYMAPEQRRGQAIDHRCDQYSLCLTLCEALAGRHPLADLDPGELDDAIHRLATPSAAHWGPVPHAWRRILRRGLREQPEDRFGDMHALIEALEHAARRRQRWKIGTVATVMLAGGAGLAMWPAQGPGPHPPNSELDCNEQAAEILAVWDQPRRQRVETRFTQTELPYSAATWAQVDRDLSAHADDLARAQAQACAARPEDPTLRDAQHRCLQLERQRFEQLAARMEQIDGEAMSRISTTLAQVLDDLARCLDPEQLSRERPPLPAVLASQVLTLRSAIAGLEQLRSLGQFAQSAAWGREIVQEARALDYPSVLAEALVAAGRAAHSNGEYVQSIRDLQEGYFLSGTISYEDLMVEAAVQMIVVAAEHDDHELATTWSRHARADLDRTQATDQRWADFHANEGIARQLRGDYAEALQHMERARAIVDARQPPQFRARFDIRNNAALALTELGRFEEARTQLAEARELADQALPEGHPELATLYDNLGGVESELRNLEQALVWCQRALTIRRANLGADHPDIATSEYNVGHALWLLGRYEEALTHAETSLAITERNGSSPASVALSRRLLSLVLRDNGEAERATAQLQRALYELEAELGPEHPSVVSILTQLGHSQFLAGRPEEAITTMRRAATRGERVLGPLHLDVALIYSNLGNTLFEVGRTEEALRELRRAIDIQERNPECPPVSLAISYHNLGGTLVNIERYEDAVATLRKAVELERRLAPEATNRLLLGASLTSLGAILSKSGSSKSGEARSATTALEEAVEITAALDSPDGRSRLANALTALGKHWLRRGKPARARPMLERADAIDRPGAFDRGHVANTRFSLARALLETRGDRQRAVALARGARDTWAELGDWNEQLGQAERWLEQHDAP